MYPRITKEITFLNHEKDTSLYFLLVNDLISSIKPCLDQYRVFGTDGL